jgi:hypothetical protein
MGSDALHPAPRQMNTSLVTLTDTLSAVSDVIDAFVALRDACSDDDWDTLHEAAPMGRLLDALTELEDAAE